jgi:hypothetical protein
VLVSIVCHVSLLCAVRVNAQWKLNGA